jgi:hypothetical protein
MRTCGPRDEVQGVPSYPARTATNSASAELRITSVFPCVARGLKACASFKFTGCCWWRSLAVDGGSGTPRGCHAFGTLVLRRSARSYCVVQVLGDPAWPRSSPDGYGGELRRLCGSGAGSRCGSHGPAAGTTAPDRAARRGPCITTGTASARRRPPKSLAQRIEVQPAEVRVIERERSGNRRRRQRTRVLSLRVPVRQVWRIELVSRYRADLNGHRRMRMMQSCGREDQASADQADASERPDLPGLAQAATRHVAEPSAAQSDGAATPRWTQGRGRPRRRSPPAVPARLRLR